jgi:hypothetical protein
MRDLFAREALALIPKLLTLQDRNPHSPTYGCFDRNFWHYKIIDFPSGMAQEFVWPLALAWATDIPDNPYYRNPAVREWVEAGILFAARSAHPDGSCDDYYPYERAMGAAAFSLLACIESCKLLDLDDPEILRFLEKRADWLAGREESGQLANHQALVALALELLGRLLGSNKWDEPRSRRLKQVLSWQSPEGWFIEYGGCDPGYHTLTVGCLAELQRLRPDPGLEEALQRAVALAAQFVHPDGSYGGEYGSRNTYNFFPHGFEVLGRRMPEALRVNDAFLRGLAEGRAPCYADDHILGHHAWSYLLAWREWVPERPAPAHRPEGRVWLPGAEILIDRREGTELYAALNKGGVFKLFRDGRLVCSDTQWSLRVRQGGKVKNAVGHLMGDYAIEAGEDEISIRGQLGWAKQKQMTPRNLLLLRLLTLTLGRVAPNLVRSLLQKLLITGKQDAPFTFHRRFRWEQGRWVVTDELKADSWAGVLAAGIGGAQTSIYVVMSRTFQAGQLQPWLDLTAQVRKLAPGEPLRLQRSVER